MKSILIFPAHLPAVLSLRIRGAVRVSPLYSMLYPKYMSFSCGTLLLKHKFIFHLPDKMGEICGTHVLVGKSDGRIELEDVVGRILLKWGLKKQDGGA